MSFNDYIYWQTLQETGKTPEEIYEYEHPEVVRRKDCKHWTYEEACEVFKHFPTCFDDFCSYGERI